MKFRAQSVITTGLPTTFRPLADNEYVHEETLASRHRGHMHRTKRILAKDYLDPDGNHF
jgi:hypothetical protein